MKNSIRFNRGQACSGTTVCHGIYSFITILISCSNSCRVASAFTFETSILPMCPKQTSFTLCHRSEHSEPIAEGAGLPSSNMLAANRGSTWTNKLTCLGADSIALLRAYSSERGIVYREPSLPLIALRRLLALLRGISLLGAAPRPQRHNNGSFVWTPPLPSYYMRKSTSLPLLHCMRWYATASSLSRCGCNVARDFGAGPRM
jgi:hypothetical protein